MTPQRDLHVYLEDILEASFKAIRFLEGVTFEQFENDERTAFAVVRALEIVGEAAKHIPPVVRDRAPEIPWQEMAGMRDKLIHGYQGVDLRVVWRTVREDLPTVVDAIRELQEQLFGD